MDGNTFTEYANPITIHTFTSYGALYVFCFVSLHDLDAVNTLCEFV